MNKKYTLLLTVITVATLLVAVVGLTFAYFTSDNKVGGTTNIEVTTESVGSVAVTNPTPNMHITLTTSEMSNSNKGVSYWATSGYSSYATSAEHNSVARVTITGDKNNYTYNCTFRLNISKPSQIRSGDVTLILTTNGATITGLTSGSERDLYGLSTSYTVSFSQTGNVENKSIITAAAKLNNTTSSQNHLAGQTLNLYINNSNISCTIAK